MKTEIDLDVGDRGRFRESGLEAEVTVIDKGQRGRDGDFVWLKLRVDKPISGNLPGEFEVGHSRSIGYYYTWSLRQLKEPTP